MVRLGAGGRGDGAAEITGRGVWVVVVAVAGNEARGLVDVLGGGHVGGGVEDHGGVAGVPGLLEDRGDEGAADAHATGGGLDVETLHLACAGREPSGRVGEWPHGDTAGETVADVGEEDGAPGGRVLARE